MISRKKLIHLSALLFDTALVLMVVFMVDPTGSMWGGARIAWVKYFPIGLALLAVLPHLISNSVLKIPSWPFASLFVLVMAMLGGSLYTLVVYERMPMNTWLGRALIASIFVVTSRLFTVGVGRNLQVFSVVTARMAYLAMVVTTWLFLWGKLPWDLTQVYHAEAVFILAAGIAFALSARRGKGWWWVMLLLAAGGLIGVGKFTTYTLIGASGGISVFLWLARIQHSKTRQLDRLMINGFRALVGILVLVTLFFLAQEVIQARANVRVLTVREQTFEQRFVQWQQHPWFGTLFVGTPIVTVGPLVIPSHSDWLDVLAFGGVGAFLLLLLPTGYLAWRSLQIVASRSQRSLWHSWMPLFSIYYVAFYMIAMIANPILGVPYLGFWFWMSLGYLSVYARGKIG